MEPAALSAAQQIQMRIGPRFQTWLSEGGSRTELLNETTVSSPATFVDAISLTLSSGKKLKRRLEDLERRAGSSSASPPQMHVELQQQDRPQETQQQHYKRSPEIVHRQPSPRLLPNQYTPPMDDNLMFSNHYEREGSRTPPLFYHTYPAPEEIVYPSFPSYRPMTTADHYGDYLAPVTLPSMMHFHEAVKREDDTISPFNMSYNGLPAIDIHGSHGYDDTNPHVSELNSK